MAYYSSKDISACTYNSTDLKAFVMGIDGLSIEEIVTEFRAPGSASKSRKLTGNYDHGDPTIDFIYDGTATGPAVKCAQGTSATLTLTLGTGISITGTAVVKSWEFTIDQDGGTHDVLKVGFMWDGGATWDLSA